MGYMTEVKTAWEDLTKYMCEQIDMFEQSDKGEGEDKDIGKKGNIKLELGNL